MKKISLVIFTQICLMALVSNLCAEDWPSWRGLNRTGISSESLPTKGIHLSKLWDKNIGSGYSIVSVYRGQVYAMGHSKGQDTVYCFDEKTGTELWKHSYACGDNKKFEGTRSTPVADDGKIYTLSREGHLMSFEAGAKKKLLWSVHLQKDHGMKNTKFGFSSSPFINGGSLYLNVGSHGLAVGKLTGKLLWKSGSTGASYATPVLMKKDLLLIFPKNNFVGVDPKSGAVKWEYKWKSQYGVNAADPLVIGEKVLITTGYRKGSAMLDLKSGQPKLLWQNKNLQGQFASPVLWKNHIYGNDNGALKCLSVKEGTVLWEKKGIGKGALILVDEKLVVMTEKGELVIASAKPDAYSELFKMKILNEKCWTAPVFSGGKFYAKGVDGQLVCYTLENKAS